MNVGSLFSGIGGMDYGLAAAGHQHVFFCEADPWRRQVLAARWPGVPIYDDVRMVRADTLRDMPAMRRDLSDRSVQEVRVVGLDGGEGIHSCDEAARSSGRSDGRRTLGGELDNASPNSTREGISRSGVGGIDLLCGGFPCQDLSVAGKRRGLAGNRSGLFFEFARIIDAFRPRWVLIENVPGLFSSNGGRDFGVVLGTLADLGYGVAWRTLDSRFFGVPQRRRRVFIVGAVADGDPRAAAERAGEILAVGSRCARHPAKGGQAGPDVASTLGGSVGDGRGHDGNPFDRGGRLSGLSGMGSGGPDDNDAQAGRLVSFALTGSQERQDASVETLRRGRESGAVSHEETLVAHPLTSEGFDASEDGTGRGTPPVAAPLTSGGHPNSNEPGRRKEDDVNLVTSITLASDPISAENLAQPSTKRNGDPGVIVGQSVGVRRLTPRECERLQGLPEWRKSCRIVLWDWPANPRNDAVAVPPNHSALISAWTVADDGSWLPASPAAPSSPTPHHVHALPVVARALINLEANEVRLLSQNESIVSASGADELISSRLHMRADDFARLAAGTLRTLASATPLGAVASQANSAPSGHRPNGRSLVVLSGRETAALASDAELFTSTVTAALRSITSEVGASSQNFALSLTTLCSCVAVVIYSLTLDATQSGSSFAFDLTVASGWTQIGDTADSRRYSAVGDAVTVTVAQWIAERLPA